MHTTQIENEIPPHRRLNITAMVAFKDKTWEEVERVYDVTDEVKAAVKLLGIKDHAKALRMYATAKLQDEYSNVVFVHITEIRYAVSRFFG